ncbi:OmpA family protein [Malonomonas rubra]|uniref:OmpA family protein n=1 Tax=Malonomonas rubra TaxID=57040 RepID=UPI0026EB48A4|nr:OmpA family protein [Malonomonas rubra]
MLRTSLILCLVLPFFLIFCGCAAKNEAVLEPAVTPEVEAVAPQPNTIEEVIKDQSSSDESLVAPATAEEVHPIDVSDLDIIFFASNSYELTDQAKQLLDDHAEWMQTHQGSIATIEGNCDERGSDEYNMALGERRALATKEYLVQLGIAPERLTILSLGEENPAVVGHDEIAWARNRRVEFR